MESDIIDRMRREEAELVRKLSAVRGLLDVYGEQPSAAPSSDGAPVAEQRQARTPKATRSREKLPVERFSTYGQAVVTAAIEECKRHLGSPISSKDMVGLVESKGILVRGEDKANAISALLARSMDLKPNGRKGWTLSDELLLHKELEEIEPPNGDPKDGSNSAQEALLR